MSYSVSNIMGFILLGLILAMFGSFLFRTFIVAPVIFFIVLMLSCSTSQSAGMGAGETFVFAICVTVVIMKYLF